MKSRQFYYCNLNGEKRTKRCWGKTGWWTIFSPYMCILFVCVCICLCVCLHMYTHACAWVSACVCISVCIWKCMCMCVCMCIYVCVCMCAGVCAGVCVCKGVCMCICVCAGVWVNVHEFFSLSSVRFVYYFQMVSNYIHKTGLKITHRQPCHLSDKEIIYARQQSSTKSPRQPWRDTWKAKCLLLASFL